MNRYYVLGTNSDIIEIEADNYVWEYESGYVAFYKSGKHSNKVVGIFQLSNIVGVYDIKEDAK